MTWCELTTVIIMCSIKWSHRHDDDDGLGDHSVHIGEGDLGPPRPRPDLGGAGLWPLDPGGLQSASLLALILVRTSQSVNRSVVTQIVCWRNYFSHSNWTWVIWEMWNMKWNMHHQNISFLIKCFMSHIVNANWEESVFQRLISINSFWFIDFISTSPISIVI